MLVVEDGSGIENADAYVDVDFVDGYAEKYGKTDWTGDQAAKEVHVRRATQFADNVYLSEFQPNTMMQRLMFPASGVYIRGYHVTGIPIQLKEAVAELSTISMQMDLVEVQKDRNPIQVTKKAGDVSKSETFASPVHQRVFHPVEMILRPLLSSSNIGRGVKTVKMVRA